MRKKFTDLILLTTINLGYQEKVWNIVVDGVDQRIDFFFHQEPSRGYL
jgi:hypothetical protein